MSLKLENNEGGCLLQLDGEITVNCAADLHRLLAEATASGKELAIAFSPQAEIDVSAIQLLYAARKEAERTGGSIRTEGDLPAQAEAAFRDAGIDPFAEVVLSGGRAWEK